MNGKIAARERRQSDWGRRTEGTWDHTSRTYWLTGCLTREEGFELHDLCDRMSRIARHLPDLCITHRLPLCYIQEAERETHCRRISNNAGSFSNS